MKEESFDECMERLFNSLASGKSCKSMNRLDLFQVLFDDQQKKIDELNNELGESDGMVVSLMAKLVAMENKLAQAKKENKLLTEERNEILATIHDCVGFYKRMGSSDEFIPLILLKKVQERHGLRELEAKIGKPEEQKKI